MIAFDTEALFHTATEDEKAEAMKHIADTLWLDGWSKDDRAQLIEQYDLTADDADAICELLGKIEEAEEAEDEMEEAKEAEAMRIREAEDEKADRLRWEAPE